MVGFDDEEKLGKTLLSLDPEINPGDYFGDLGMVEGLRKKGLDRKVCHSYHGFDLTHEDNVYEVTFMEREK